MIVRVQTLFKLTIQMTRREIKFALEVEQVNYFKYFTPNIDYDYIYWS